MKTLNYFIMNGTEEQKYTASEIKILAREEREMEEIIKRLRSDDENQPLLFSAMRTLKSIRTRIGTFLQFARNIEMDDSDFVALNYRQYVGESIVVEK